MTVQIIKGDCRDVLRTLPAESVHCVVTSPPYWGLRDYGVAGQIGLESSPEAFARELTTVFREVLRVLRKDGTVWLNLGDCYASTPPGCQNGGVSESSTLHGVSGISATYRETLRQSVGQKRNTIVGGLKAKDLVGAPWMVAFALRADGWYLRQDIIWSKPNPMPESVRDRCTKAHEYLFLLSKSERYHYDADAIAEDAAEPDRQRNDRIGGANGHAVRHSLGGMMGASVKRNRRSVWEVTTSPFSEAHFATFPPALIEPCILAGCPKGGTVLDPFGGAGTTGLVADRLGRNAILIELNPEYAEMAERRIKGDAPLFAEVTS